MEPIYVTGHKNPDTDSIVAALAYASLRNALGERAYEAARIGDISDETHLVLEKFGFEPLLGNVREVRWRFLTGGTRVDAWPPGDRRSALPDAVILELELPDHGTLTRFIALR